MKEKKISCPFCREWFIEGAIKCRYCGSMLSDNPPPSGSVSGIQLVQQALGNRYEIQHEIGGGEMAKIYAITLAYQKQIQPIAVI